MNDYCKFSAPSLLVGNTLRVPLIHNAKVLNTRPLRFVCCQNFSVLQVSFTRKRDNLLRSARSGLPVWLFLGQICHFWPFLNSSGFFLLLKKRPFLVSYIFMSIWQIKHDFCRFLGIGRFLDTVSGHRTINCYWKLCMRIHDFLCCCFNPVCSFRLLFSKTKRFEKLINGVSFIVFMYKICRLYIAFQKHVWVFSWWCCVFILDFWCYLAFLRVYLAFFAYGYLAPWRQFPWVNAREEQVDIAFICSHSLCLETYIELRIVVQFAFALSLL